MMRLQDFICNSLKFKQLALFFTTLARARVVKKSARDPKKDVAVLEFDANASKKHARDLEFCAVTLEFNAESLEFNAVKVEFCAMIPAKGLRLLGFELLGLGFVVSGVKKENEHNELKISGIQSQKTIILSLTQIHSIEQRNPISAH